jgi:hypothetical protein
VRKLALYYKSEHGGAIAVSASHTRSVSLLGLVGETINKHGLPVYEDVWKRMTTFRS